MNPLTNESLPSNLVLAYPEIIQISAQEEAVLADYFDMRRRSCSPNTLRGIKTDIGLFLDYCRANGRLAIPAELETLRGFIRHRAEQKVKAATISRAISAISKLHDAIHVPNACRSDLVREELKIVRKTTPQRQKQAEGIPYSALIRWDEQIADSEDLSDIRDRAMMWCFYDGLLRGDEAQRAEMDWLEFLDSGDAILHIPTHKTDQEGEGSEIYLSAHTVEALRRWLDVSGIQDGRLFRSFKVSGELRDSISTNGIRQIIGKRGFEMGVIGASNHSLRVGATQDLLEAGESTGRIQLAGRWKHENMVIKYGRKHRAKTGAMAELAKQQGRS